MPLFLPLYRFKRIQDIPLEFIASLNIRAILLDVDNTLTTHNSPDLNPEVLEWLRKVEEHGIKLIIASNNSKERVEPFASNLGFDYEAKSRKPLPIGFNRARKRINSSPKETLVIGDQIFTDILGANLAGMCNIFVDPIMPEEMLFFKIKRFFEKPILRSFNRRQQRKKCK